jgi:hypothetical protein
MTSAELALDSVSRPRRGVRALEAQRVLELVTLRVAPAVAAGAIAALHMAQLGQGLLVFTCTLLIAQAMDRSHLPLHLMPATRVLIGITAPVIGIAIAW